MAQLRVTFIHCLINKHEHELDVYLKLLVLLYADDTVLMAENAIDLQQQLNVFTEYCKTWKLKVNVNKSNVLIFSNGRTLKKPEVFI